MHFRNLKLGAKQAVGFVLILILMTTVNVYTLTRMRSLKSDLDIVSRNWLPRIIAVSAINQSTSDLRIDQLQHAVSSDSTTKAGLAIEIVALIDQINENLDVYGALRRASEELSLYSTEEEAAFARFDLKWEEYQDQSFEFFALSQANRTDEAVALLEGEARRVFDEFSAALVELVRINREQATAAANAADVVVENHRKHTLLVFVIILGATAVLAVVLSRVITRPLRTLSGAAEKVSEGDLSVRVNDPATDEIGALARTFDTMTESLARARARTERQRIEIEAKNTDLEKALDQLRKAQEQLVMSEKMASLGDLVAGVAHELNNPAGVVISAGDVSNRCAAKMIALLDSGTSLDDDQSRAQMAKFLGTLESNTTIVETAARRITEIVRSLRNFARLDEAEFQQVDIHEGIESSLTLMGSEALNRITVEKDFGDLPKIGCYPARLNQVFIGLLKNAAAAIADSGTIRITTTTDTDSVVVRIADTGRGISPERLKRIFEFGFGSEGQRVKLGSGLSTAYNIIREHKGDITVDSEVGIGSTVTVRLPVST